MDTNSNKSSAVLTVLMPDTTYQVKVQTQCLSKQHKTNEVLTLRTPEGCESVLTAQSLKWFLEQLRFIWKRYGDDFLCVAVPDPPQNLQLSSDNAEDGTVLCSWSPPDKAHGLIREYIVSEKPSVLHSIYQPILISNQLVCVLCRWSTVKRTVQSGIPSVAPSRMQKWRTCSPARSTDSG